MVTIISIKLKILDFNFTLSPPQITVDEDGTAHYTDKDGDEITIEIDQTIKDKTDEELDDDYEEIFSF